MVRWLLGVKNNQSKSGNSTLRMLTAILSSDGDSDGAGQDWVSDICSVSNPLLATVLSGVIKTADWENLIIEVKAHFGIFKALKIICKVFTSDKYRSKVWGQ